MTDEEIEEVWTRLFHFAHVGVHGPQHGIAALKELVARVREEAYEECFPWDAPTPDEVHDSYQEE